MDQEIKFCTTEAGVRLAYAQTGLGPPLVRAAHWMTHLEFDIQSPVSRHWIEGLSTGNTLLRYDERGCGLSDWDVDDFSLDAWVADLEAVVDAAGVERFPLIGISQGGPVAVAYAVRHPERVTHLILYGTYATGWRHRDLPPEALKEHEALTTLTRQGWGRESPAYRQLFAGLFVPEADADQLRAYNELQRVTTSPENAARFLDAFGELDVSDLLPELRLPTLVLHGRGDARCPFEEGRKLAAAIADSRFVQLDSVNHILLKDEAAWTEFLHEIHNFLGVEAPKQSFPVSPVSVGVSPEPKIRRRRIVRWTVPYGAAAMLLAGAADMLTDPWGISLAVIRSVQILLLVGLVVVIGAALAGDVRDRRAS